MQTIYDVQHSFIKFTCIEKKCKAFPIIIKYPPDREHQLFILVG